MDVQPLNLPSDNLSYVLRKLIDNISFAPAGASGLDIIYKMALESLKETIGIERASILLFDPDGVMRFKAWLGISDKYRKAVEGHTPWTQEHRNPSSIIVSDIYKDASLASHLATFESEDIRALAFIPLLYRSRVIGKFMLYSRIQYDFTKEIEPAITIAQLVAYGVVRKKIEDQLSRSESRMKAILENEPECLNIINSHGIVLEMNPAGLSLLETDDPAKVIGHSFVPIIMESHRNAFRELTDRVCHGEKGFLEFELVTFRGTKRFVETHAVPLHSDEHDETVLLAITRDITEKKRVELEREDLLIKEKEARLGAEKSIQLRDDFLSIASHELKTPLTPIRMNFQLVKKYLQSFASDLPKSEMLVKVFENTDLQFDRFFKLVDNLLDVSRITADRLVLVKENFNLSELINEIVQRFRTAFINAGCDLILNIEETIMVYCDPVRIEQVVVNLLSNAMKYGVNHPVEVRLSLEKKQTEEAKAILLVRDHGIGIAKTDQEKIFSRFERAASANYFGGLGLGLYIASNLVAAHGGNIRVKSELGKGATFIVELPVLEQTKLS